MCTPEDIENYHCPRWNELPDIELYMDQVVTVLEKFVSIFNDNVKSKSITPMMINNYVKQKIVKPPFRKKYDRTHLAHFFIVCLLKKIISLNEICEAMKKILVTYTVEDAYNLFCDEFEASLRYVFNLDSCEEIITVQKANEEDSHVIATIKSITLAFANIYYSRYRVSMIVPPRLLAAKN